MKYTFIALAMVAMGCLAFVMNGGTANAPKEVAKAKCTLNAQECSEATKKSCCMAGKSASAECTEAKRKACCAETASVGEGGGEAEPAEELTFFSGSWKELLAKAEKDKKPFWVDVYTTWCGPCKIMARQTFTDGEVGRVSNKTFIAYKMDAEKGDGIKVASDYNVDGYPTILFFGADGKLLGREIGMQDAEKFAYLLDKYAKKTGKSKKKSKK